MLNADGSLDTTVGQLEGLITGGVQAIANQNCTLASGTSGTSPNDCASGALHDAQLVVQNCPNGVNDNSSALSERPQRRPRTTPPASSPRSARSRRRRPRRPRRSATPTRALGAAEAAQAQAAVELADEENAYLNYQSFQQTEKAGFDVLNLAVSLSVSEIDPVNAVGALLNVVGDAVGFGFSGPIRTR